MSLTETWVAPTGAEAYPSHREQIPIAAWSQAGSVACQVAERPPKSFRRCRANGRARQGTTPRHVDALGSARLGALDRRRFDCRDLHDALGSMGWAHRAGVGDTLCRRCRALGPWASQE